jgi:hypothetical protein
VFEDIKWAQERGLRATVEGRKLIVSGQVSYHAFYDGIRLHYGASIPLFANPEKVIQDTWTLSVGLDYDKLPVPLVFDLSNRLVSAMKNNNLNPEDLHLNSGSPMPPYPYMPKNSFCVSPAQQLIECYNLNFNLNHYFKQYLLPFLYQLSFFEKSEYKTWPWNNYSHGERGLDEWRRERWLGQDRKQ